MLEILFFLSSGIFLGWSLGANDAANVFGTAVGSKMIRFETAALICSVFLIIGAVFGGSGGAHTLGKLGAINTLAGAFTVALASAITVLFMTKASLPVSTSQAIVGGIVGWNFFSGFNTDVKVFSKIVSTWFLCPLLAMGFAIFFYLIFRKVIPKFNIHILRLDSYTRIGLIIVGAFGSYSLGANNIANVMGVFVPSSPFSDVVYFGITFTSTQKLFLLGALAIAAGVFTYSRRVMTTVGQGILKLSPLGALIVVLSSSIVLYMFASRGLHDWMISVGLPPIPLVPVSSSQAVVGAVLGLGLIRGGMKNINFKMLGEISVGWFFTPLISAIICFVMLYFMQNVFMTQVHL